MSVMIPVSWGELVDKITILEIKQKRIADADKVRRVSDQLSHLRSVRHDELSSCCSPDATGQLEQLMTELSETNRRIWSAENAIRRHERLQDFGSEFVEAARSVRRDNDYRVVLKNRIDELLGSDMSEVKHFVQD